MTDLINRIKQAQVHAGEQAVIAHLAEEMAELDIEHWVDDRLPEWATGRATSSTDFGAQLSTRDGRRCGNAVVMECHLIIDKPFVIVCTDAGNLMTLSPSEVDKLFYPAKWLMDPNTAPGVIRHTVDTRNEKVKKYVEADDNGLPKGSPESDSFILEHAMNVGFEMIDDDGDVYVCNSRQVVALVKPYKDAHELMSNLSDDLIDKFFKKSPFLVRRAEDRSCFEIVEMTNHDFRDVIFDPNSFVHIESFGTYPEAYDVRRRMSARWAVKSLIQVAEGKS